MAENALSAALSDPVRSRNLALILGALGGPLIAIGIAIESVPLLVLGVIGLAASGAVWTIRGIKEDQVKE